MAKAVQVESKPGLVHLSIALPKKMTKGLKTGASVAIDGVCLTVVSIDTGITSHPLGRRPTYGRAEDTRGSISTVSFDLMDETLRLTTLVNIAKDQMVNVERSLRIGDELGGHLVSGHVHGTAKILDITRSENNCTITLEPPAELAKYIFPKGSITLNGVSLTVVDGSPSFQKGARGSRFSVSLIPETLARTTFGAAQISDLVNLEVDQQTRTIVDTITRIRS
jgi:riboflavin synthase